MKDVLLVNDIPVTKRNTDALRDVGLSPVADFLDEWWDDSPTVTVRTSGSTGTPKVFTAEKSRMLASARMTCCFLGLTSDDDALLCMPVQFIGAKMVVVRAICQGFRLTAVTPSSHPLAGLSHTCSFAAMTPSQAYSSLDVREEADALKRIGRLILGGGPIDPSLQERLLDFPHEVWSTYGMTETLSHIALRRLNGKNVSDAYRPLKGVSLSLSPKGTLVIDAPAICQERLTTNDIAEILPDGTFRILGRIDNVINTGGIKVHIEEIEATLRPHIPVPFFITSVHDANYGEAVALVTEGVVDDAIAICQKNLPKHISPKHHFTVGSLPLTTSGKPDRPALRRLAATYLQR